MLEKCLYDHATGLVVYIKEEKRVHSDKLGVIINITFFVCLIVEYLKDDFKVFFYYICECVSIF